MQKKIVIATHSFSPGTSQAFRDYCLRKKYEVLFIEHSLFGSVLQWIIGVLDTGWKVVKRRQKFDLFIGSNRLNASMGIVLKKIGVVNRVVYFSPDWSSKRFNNSFLNFIFQKFDYFCVHHADCVWNSSHIMKIDPMMKERLKLGYPKNWLKKQIQVPDGTESFPFIPFSRIHRYQIGFVGHLVSRSGIDLLINSFADIKKELPYVSALVIGSGELENLYKKKAKHMAIHFAGFVGNIKKVFQLLSHCAVAIAPYQPNSISQFTDPGKVKNYLSIHLPIIITKVPQIAYEIEKERCGIAIKYDKKEFTQAVIKLLKNGKRLNLYRRNTIKLSKKYSWDTIFDRALYYTDTINYEKK